MARDKYTESDLITALTYYRMESNQARLLRMEQNKINYDTYHMRQDFTYKVEGQSTEFLPKMRMAVEQAANFLQQGLIDIGDWFGVEPEEGLNVDAMKVKPDEIRTLLDRQLRKNGFMIQVGDFAKSGMIGSLMIAKVHGQMVSKPIYRSKNKLKGMGFTKILEKATDKVWELKIDIIRQEDWFPDPRNKGLYVMQDLYMDYYEVERMAKGEDAIYDLKAVEQLKGTFSVEGLQKDYNKNRETNQNATNSAYRNTIKLTEIWGNIVSPEGELMYENVMCTIANDQYVIQKPIPNPYWHGENPYVAVPIISVAHSPWGTALMDAPSMLNKAINEIFNLITDGGIMAVHGIKQIREHWLEDVSQIEDGINPGTTLKVNSACPPGATALERVDTSSVPQDGLNVLNLLNQEFNVAALTNDLRLGVAPFRAVKATEIVEASQSITSMFSGIAKQIESAFIGKILEKSWKTIAQNMNDMDKDWLGSLLGDKRANELRAMGNTELFAETVGKAVFRVYGVSATLNKQKEFTKLQAMLQTISASPILQEEFTKKYDFGKLLGEIMKSLDINEHKIQADHDESAQPAPASPTPEGAPNVQSQIPQAGAAVNQGDLDPASQVQPGIPVTEFPASRATPSQ